MNALGATVLAAAGDQTPEDDLFAGIRSEVGVR